MYSPVPSVVAILVALLLIVPLVAFVVWYFRVRRKTTSNMGILSETDGNAANAGDVNQSYENPYFNQEITMSHLQVSLKMPTLVSCNVTLRGILVYSASRILGRWGGCVTILAHTRIEPEIKLD